MRAVSKRPENTCGTSKIINHNAILGYIQLALRQDEKSPDSPFELLFLFNYVHTTESSLNGKKCQQ